MLCPLHILVWFEDQKFACELALQRILVRWDGEAERLAQPLQFLVALALDLT